MMLSGEIQSITLRIGRRPARQLVFTLLAFGIAGSLAAPAAAQLNALRVEDFAIAPMTGSVNGTNNNVYLARVNFMADDPVDSNRFFVNDLNGPMYVLDKTTKSFTEYLNFNGRGLEPGLYDRLWTSGGYAGGLITFQFDPDYAHNGKFYTVHMEQGSSGSELPSTANYPNLNITNYGVTASIDAPSSANYRHVLVEWTDTDPSNSTFEGSARELLRMDARDRIHPIGDIIFNPTAGPDDPDWRMMYVSIGDAGNGEQTDPAVRRTPQLLNTLGGKILRIAPDTDVNIATTASPNGKYRIPTDNPFTGVADPGGTNGTVRDEIWALGFRNPHRMSWDVDPTNPENNYLIVNDIGLHSWEEVNIVHKGENYGYSLREGNEQLISNTVTGPIPANDRITNQQVCAGVNFDACTSNGSTTPTYPVIQYGHGLPGQDQLVAGDSISSGYVYRGSKIPQLYGKYLFGDITTGVLYYAELADMLAADDGDPATLADFHSLDILWDDPNDGPDDGEELYTTLTSSNAIRGGMFQIIDKAYHDRGGEDPNLPGTANVTGGGLNGFGRADIRIQIDDQGELFIISKSDGMIRAITGPEPLPGDYNYDGLVDAEDYNTWKASFGETVPQLGLWADGNKDGIINAADYTVWRDNFLGAGSGAGAVPEPGTAILLLAALGLMPALRRRRA